MSSPRKQCEGCGDILNINPYLVKKDVNGVEKTKELCFGCYMNHLDDGWKSVVDESLDVKPAYGVPFL